MRTARARAYDPFQPSRIDPGSSIAPVSREAKSASTPDTARYYGESYWYAQGSGIHMTRVQPNLATVTTGWTSIGNVLGVCPAFTDRDALRATAASSSGSQFSRLSLFFRTSTYAPQSTRFEVLQKWEGTVLDVLTDSFTARLCDLTRQGADEEAEFAIEEMDASDLDLLKPGAIFYWNIGYADSPTGRARVSIIRFRRLPMWHTHEIERAGRDAQRLSQLLEWK